MNYRTINELEHFDFSEAYVADVQVTGGFFHVILDNVTILPENSCNRDIRKMRTNQLMLKLEKASVASIVKEGFKVYDANGNLKEAYEDVEIVPEAYAGIMKTFAEGMVYSLTKEADEYSFVIDIEDEGTYVMRVMAEGDVEEWDRFYNLEMGY